MPDSNTTGTEEITPNDTLPNNAAGALEMAEREIIRVKAWLSNLVLEKTKALGIDVEEVAQSSGMRPIDLADMTSSKYSSVTVEQLQAALRMIESFRVDDVMTGDKDEPLDKGYYVDKSPEGLDRYYPLGIAGGLPSPKQITAVDPKVFGTAIRAQRKKARLTQDDVAAKMSVSRGLVSQWESGQSRVVANDLSRLALALGTTLVDLVNSVHMIESPPVSLASGSADSNTRAEYQEHILVSAFRLMTDEQREMTIRVVNALRS